MVYACRKEGTTIDYVTKYPKAQYGNKYRTEYMFTFIGLGRMMLDLVDIRFGSCQNSIPYFIA